MDKYMIAVMFSNNGRKIKEKFRETTFKYLLDIDLEKQNNTTRKR